MAYDELLAKRVQKTLAACGLEFSERKMFGGIAFMLNGNMCCGIIQDELVLRVGREVAREMIEDDHIRTMDFTGRPMHGFVMVEPKALMNNTSLFEWLEPAISFASNLPPK
ncbi:RNA methyltransferase [bacterium]|nr:RNA methyltransferase [bacterium]